MVSTRKFVAYGLLGIAASIPARGFAQSLAANNNLAEWTRIVAAALHLVELVHQHDLRLELAIRRSGSPATGFSILITSAPGRTGARRW